MIDNYKVLAQTSAASIEEISGEYQANVVYTVPENTQAAVSSISLVNTSATSEEYSLGIVKAEDVSISSEILDTRTETTFNYEKILSGLYFRRPYLYDSKNPELGFQVNQSLFLISQYNLGGIAYGNGRLVALVRNSNQFFYSSDGSVWTAGSLPASREWYSIKFLNNTFVATAIFSADIIYSVDGINWNLQTTSSSSAQSEVFFIDNKFFIFSDNFLDNTMFSTDLISWSPPQYSPAVGWVVQKENVLIASDNNIYRSTNGTSWSLVLDTSERWSRAVVGGGLIAVSNTQSGGYDEPGRIAVSSDNGLSWNVYNTPSTNGFSRIHYILEKFYAKSSNAQFNYVSTDAITWTVYQIGSYPLNVQSLLSDTGPLSLVYVPYQEVVRDGVLSVVNSISPKATIIPDRSIEPNQVDEIVGGITLSPGDQIRVYSESEDLIVQVYGVEIE